LDVDRLSVRARSDIGLKIEIRRVFNENFQVYGVRNFWRQLQREGYDIARCTVARLMRSMSLQSIIRGKPVKTTVSDKAAARRSAPSPQVCRKGGKRQSVRSAAITLPRPVTGGNPVQILVRIPRGQLRKEINKLLDIQ
jgi:transposase InsO family protein